MPAFTLAAVAALALMSGCGGSATGGTAPGSGAGAATGPAAAGSGGSTTTAPPTVGPGVDPAAVAVIRGWSDALRRGDMAGAGRYFALPSVISFGPDASGGTPILRLRTRRQAERTGLALPCGAILVSAHRQGPYVDALFRLTERVGPGAGCGQGTGGTARTDFLIRAGRIVSWIRAADEPGDRTSAGSPPPPGGGGGTTTSPGPSVAV